MSAAPTAVSKNLSVMDDPAYAGLPAEVKKYGLSGNQWRTLKESLYPGARNESILSVVAYCRARGLDPMKKPCHIVPMQVKDAKTGQYDWRDVVMPGIYEIRTTAIRTGTYLGLSPFRYGPDIEYLGVTAPEWVEVTAYRSVHGHKAEFPHRVRFTEAVATTGGRNGKPVVVNSMWSKRPYGQLEKCAEAGALRKAFPDDIGGEMTADEMEGHGQFIEGTAVEVKPASRLEEVKALLGAKPAAEEVTEETSAAPAGDEKCEE